MKLTNEEIEAGKSAKGGWTAKTLYRWGVPWPPPKGWKAALLAGEPIPKRTKKAKKAARLRRLQKAMDAGFRSAMDRDGD